AQHHPVARDLLEPEPDQLGEAAVELRAVRPWGAHGRSPGGSDRRRASARSRWITVRVRSLRVRSMIDRATSVERRRLPVIASGKSRSASRAWISSIAANSAAPL